MWICTFTWILVRALWLDVEIDEVISVEAVAHGDGAQRLFISTHLFWNHRSPQTPLSDLLVYLFELVEKEKKQECQHPKEHFLLLVLEGNIYFGSFTNQDSNVTDT